MSASCAAAEFSSVVRTPYARSSSSRRSPRGWLHTTSLASTRPCPSKPASMASAITPVPTMPSLACRSAFSPMARHHSAMQTDAAGWLRRWEAQQQLHVPDREERFAAIIDALVAFAGVAPRVLALGCGPGSPRAPLLERLPPAAIAAIGSHPVLASIGPD